jgi:hypothetical protein
MPSTVLFTIGTTAVTATTIAVFAAKTLLAVAISSVFSKKPKSNDFGGAANEQQITSTEPVAPWRFIYGEQLVGGTYVFKHVRPQIAGDLDTVSEQHSAAATVTVLSETNPVNPGTFVADVTVEFQNYDGEDGNSYEALTKVGSNPAQGQYSVAAGVYTFNAADFNRPVRITFQVTVNKRTVGKILHLVIELAQHECEEIGDIYFDDEVIPLNGDGMATGRLYGRAYVFKHLGGADQEADSRLVASVPELWTTAHRLRGRAYIIVSLIKDINPAAENNFPNGVPNIRAKVKGRKVYDPRTGLTAYSTNNALCVADYLCNSQLGLNHTYATEINETLLIAAANICDEAVALASGGTESRYTCNGTIDASEQPKDILGRLKASMSGNIVRIGGKWNIYAGAYITPTVTLTEDHLRGPIQVKSRVSRRELFNGVKGVFASPDNKYQPADFPVVTNATYLAEDQGERIWLDIDLPYTGSSAMAQRIAKIELEKVRQQITVVVPCKLSAWVVEPPQTLMLSNSKFGWSSKVFELVQSTLVFDQDESGAPYIGVDHVLRETAAAVYDWNSGEETAVDLAPDTSLPNPFAIATPGTPAVTEEKYRTTGSAGVKSRAIVTWAASADAQATQYGLEYRIAGVDAWTRRPLVRDTVDYLDDLAPATYQFRVKAFSNLFVGSAYSPTTQSQVVGLSDAPAAVAGFSVIKNGGVGYARWTLHQDLDVQINGAIIIRHSPMTSGAIWNDGIIFQEFPGGLVSGAVPLMTGTYMAKARDSSGNYSENAVSFLATEGMVTGFNTVATSTQHPDFAGLKTNVAYDGDLGGIKLDGSVLIDDMLTEVDDWPYVDGLGGVSAAGSYAFVTHLDMSSVATRRFEAALRALSFDTGDVIDEKLDLIDTWSPIDGDAINDTNVTLYARTTDDDPAGVPTWREWTPFFVADFTCRAAQFRLDFDSGNVTHNILIDQLSVRVKEPV